jgi:hypothetical protein
MFQNRHLTTTNITSKLLQSILQPSSIPTYRRAWNLYSQFLNVVFHTALGHAVSRKLFTDYLALIFKTCGLDPTKYKGHSFRIGAATFAAECGFSDAQIRSVGRWKVYSRSRPVFNRFA